MMSTESCLGTFGWLGPNSRDRRSIWWQRLSWRKMWFSLRGTPTYWRKILSLLHHSPRIYLRFLVAFVKSASGLLMIKRSRSLIAFYTNLSEEDLLPTR